MSLTGGRYFCVRTHSRKERTSTVSLSVPMVPSTRSNFPGDRAGKGRACSMFLISAVGAEHEDLQGLAIRTTTLPAREIWHKSPACVFRRGQGRSR